jgi:hypothetical protein
VINGCSIPSEFKINPAYFKVLCGTAGQQTWNDARANWLATVWQ